jgi:hypothetical protein
MLEKRYFTVQEVCAEPRDTSQTVDNVGGSITLVGILFSVSLQMTYDNPPFRACNVKEWSRRELIHEMPYKTQVQIPAQNRLARDDSALQISYGYGDFQADFKFWSSDRELEDALQAVVFFCLGREDLHKDADEQDLPEHCWVVGLILKPIWNGEVPPQYERIGWLRYCIGKPVEAWDRAQGPHMTVTII